MQVLFDSLLLFAQLIHNNFFKAIQKVKSWRLIHCFWSTVDWNSFYNWRCSYNLAFDPVICTRHQVRNQLGTPGGAKSFPTGA